MLTKAAAVILVLVISCTVPVVETPTPRPTYTPYPTLTPEPKPASPRAMKPTPTFAPELFREAGVKEQFSGDALTAIEKAQRAFDRGMYPEALGDFLEAQRLHGRTSHVLQSKIGTTYLALGQHQAAIRHYTAALEEEDNATDVVNRGITYALDMQCTPAMEDARAALAMEPATGDGIHTDAQANAILAGCYAQQGNHLQALQHADAALEIASKPGTETATWRPSTLPGTRSRLSWTAICGPRTCSSNRPCPISTRAWSFSRRATTQRPSRASRPPGKPTALPLGPSRPWQERRAHAGGRGGSVPGFQLCHDPSCSCPSPSSIR